MRLGCGIDICHKGCAWVAKLSEKCQRVSLRDNSIFHSNISDHKQIKYSERERERGRNRGRQRETQKDGERDVETKRERERERDSQTETETETESK